MKLYTVSKWGERYENNRSRKIADLRWVPIPNSHDGEKYTELIMRKDGPELFAAWVLILQVASRCATRGTLVRSNGHPHDAESLSLKTRAPKRVFEIALPYLESIGWLSSEGLEEKQTSLERQLSAPETSLERQAGDEEGKGIEGKERREEGRAVRQPTALPDAEWIQSLKSSPAYAGIDVEREIAKCAAWCTTNRKVNSRRRALNWLNRVERPLEANGQPYKRRVVHIPTRAEIEAAL